SGALIVNGGGNINFNTSINPGAINLNYAAGVGTHQGTISANAIVFNGGGADQVKIYLNAAAGAIGGPAAPFNSDVANAAEFGGITSNGNISLRTGSNLTISGNIINTNASAGSNLVLLASTNGGIIENFGQVQSSAGPLSTITLSAGGATGIGAVSP